MPKKKINPADFGITAGRLAYAEAVYRDRKYQRRKAKQAEKLEKKLDASHDRAAERRRSTENNLTRQIDAIEKTPSKLGVKLLRQIAVSDKSPPLIKAKAAEVLLRWTENLDYGRRKRRQPG